MAGLKSYFHNLVVAAGHQEITNAVNLAEVNKKAILLDLGTGPKKYFAKTLRSVQQKIQPKLTIACDLSCFAPKGVLT